MPEKNRQGENKDNFTLTISEIAIQKVKISAILKTLYMSDIWANYVFKFLLASTFQCD